MMTALAFVLALLAGFVVGVFALLGYMLWRMMRNDGWDDSNITNALRLLSHVVLHPPDFGKMYYLTREEAFSIALTDAAYDRHIDSRRPFWYVSMDELSEVVDSRP